MQSTPKEEAKRSPSWTADQFRIVAEGQSTTVRKTLFSELGVLGALCASPFASLRAIRTGASAACVGEPRVPNQRCFRPVLGAISAKRNVRDCVRKRYYWHLVTENDHCIFFPRQRTLPGGAHRPREIPSVSLHRPRRRMRCAAGTRPRQLVLRKGNFDSSARTSLSEPRAAARLRPAQVILFRWIL